MRRWLPLHRSAPRAAQRRGGAKVRSEQPDHAARAPRSLLTRLRHPFEPHSAFVRNRLLKDDVYVLRGAWPAAECEALADAARAAAAASGGWRTGRHTAFSTPDLPADALPPADAAALRAAVCDRVLRRAAARRVRAACAQPGTWVARSPAPGV